MIHQPIIADASDLAAPAINDENGYCRSCGRDNNGYEGEPCIDECPMYWEDRGVAHPAYPAPNLAAQHIAALETVPLLTDMPTSLQRARDLIREIRLGGGHYATLGRNGIAPAVEQCVKSAGFLGFDWRQRSALA